MTLPYKMKVLWQRYFPPDPRKVARQHYALQEEMERIALKISQSIEDQESLDQKSLLRTLREMRLKIERLTS